jgi:hypothetical protein
MSAKSKRDKEGTRTKEREGETRANQATDSTDPRIKPNEAARSGPSASK